MLKPHVICDIDGTVSDLTHRLHHVKAGNSKKDWDAFHKGVGDDAPHTDIIYLIRILRGQGHNVWFVSGRMDYTREETRIWLLAHVGGFEGLFMRKTDDFRSDDVVKEEIYHQELVPRLVVPSTTLLVLDDRDRVVNKWRELGFRTLQVAPGDF